jgi:hypothetical protein
MPGWPVMFVRTGRRTQATREDSFDKRIVLAIIIDLLDVKLNRCGGESSGVHARMTGRFAKNKLS